MWYDIASTRKIKIAETKLYRSKENKYIIGNMSSNNIDEIEKEFRNLDLSKKDVEFVNQPTNVSIIEELEADFPDSEMEDIEIVHKPTDVKIVSKKIR